MRHGAGLLRHIASSLAHSSIWALICYAIESRNHRLRLNQVTLTDEPFAAPLYLSATSGCLHMYEQRCGFLAHRLFGRLAPA